MRPRDDAFPQGTCFVDVVLDEDEQLRLWTSDLPSFYYSMAVTDARAKTNQFTGPVPEAEFRCFTNASAPTAASLAILMA